MIDELKELRNIIEHAAAFSNDPSSQNAAAIYDETGAQIVSPCVNNIMYPRSEKWERPQKYYYVEHAERQAIYEAARLGISLDNATMVCPWFACADCARAIVRSGIKRVIGLHNDFKTDTHNRWKESCETGDIILEESGVDTFSISHYFGINILRNGKLIEV